MNLFTQEQINTMSNDDTMRFIEGAERRETIDPHSGWAIICYWKNGRCLLYNYVQPCVAAGSGLIHSRPIKGTNRGNQ